MSLREKLAQAGAGAEMWNVRAQEQAAIQALDAQIEACTRARALAGRMQALAQAPGFSDMLDAVHELEKHATSVMLGTEETNSMFKFQGRVSAFRDVRRMMSDNEHRLSELDSQLEMLQNQRQSIVRPNENKE